MGGHNLRDVRYEDNTELLVDIERKLQEFVENVVKQNEKKELTINCKRHNVSSSVTGTLQNCS